MQEKKPRLILASGSPRRRQLLAAMGVRFEVRPTDVDESALPGESPEQHVRRLARDKSRAQVLAGELVLAADTVVVFNGDVLGKPRDRDDAQSMLRRLSGRRHVVLTGLALTAGTLQKTVDSVERSEVEIAPLSEEEIRWYVGTGEPLDKAGSYAIQGLGALFVTSVMGNYTNVVGLPLPPTQALFRELGFDLRQFCRTGGD